MNPLKQFETTARLGTFMNDVQDELQQSNHLNLRLVQNGNHPKQVGTGHGIKGLQTIEDFHEENFDVEDAPEILDEEFDEYFDSEEEDEHLQEVIERLEREDSKQPLKQAA